MRKIAPPCCSMCLAPIEDARDGNLVVIWYSHERRPTGRAYPVHKRCDRAFLAWQAVVRKKKLESAWAPLRQKHYLVDL